MYHVFLHLTTFTKILTINEINRDFCCCSYINVFVYASVLTASNYATKV